jgi:hypothetical protein
VRDEAHFSWDEVEVGDDDRSLVLRSIHSPSVWSDPDAWFNGGRADLRYTDRAVGVLLWLPECRRDDRGAARADDPSREVRIALAEPLAGRVPYDGSFNLVEPQGPATGHSDPTVWEKVQVAGPATLVVYWSGAASGPLDRIDVEQTDTVVHLTVLEQSVGKLAGQSKAAIVQLDEPLAGRKIRDGSPGR